jgi:hypothetical protein
MVCDLAYFCVMTALIVSCSDGRLAGPLAELKELLGETDADYFRVPGGVLPFTRPGTERRVFLDCIRTLVEVDDIRTMHLVSHQDCPVYERALGGLGFDQHELLERDLRKVRTLFENTFPNVEVQCHLIPWRENGDGAGFSAAEPVD